MDISINANYFAFGRHDKNRRSAEKCIGICADAGFRVVDYSVKIHEDDWREEIENTRRAADKYGVVIEQSHAPFNRYLKRPDDEYRTLLLRSVEASVRLGIKQLVIHADDYRMKDDGVFDPEDALAQVYELWAPLVEKAINNNVRIAVENVFEEHLHVAADKRSHFTATVEELTSVIEKFDDPMVGCCWDFGHANIAFGHSVSELDSMGKYIICTHVHDNYYGKDLHLLPFLGDIDWEEQMRVMRGFSYRGNLTFELVYGALPETLYPCFLKEATETGKYLRSLFEETEHRI